MIVEDEVGQYLHSFGATNRTGPLGEQDRGVAMIAEHGRDREHLPRAGEVQFLSAIEDQQPVGGHARSFRDRNRSR
jgi:hypothetical protein